MTSATLLREFTVTASTKRPPSFTGGKRGPAVTNLASIKVAPLNPASGSSVSAVMIRQQLRTPFTLLETYCEDSLDIQEGDDLVVSGQDYPVRLVHKWPGFLALVIEDLKTARPF